ncbi:MAG: S41 family peptidase [Gammaproteobacteria bacterium]
MSLKVRSILVLVVGAVLGLTISLGGGVLAERHTAESESLPVEQVRMLAEVLERVRRDYVDVVDDRELIENAIRGMVADLDPHSQFLTPSEYEEIRISTTGNYSGVGLDVSLEGGAVTVISPIDDTPAQRAGILPGDRVITIDDMPVDAANLSDTIARMRGEPGTEVGLDIVRDDEADPLHFDLVRSRVRVQSVRSEYLGDRYGYIKLTHFSETTNRDLHRSITELKRAADGRLRGVILDLRNNPGGVLDAAVDVADAFMQQGIIVSGAGRMRDARFERHARPGDVLEGAEVIVLVNRGSASASEIVAGALKDNRRARIVGDRTYGKGSVQTVMPLSDGRAIKLTTSRYFTPSGDSIHNIGILPDFIVDAGESHTLYRGINGDVDMGEDLQLQEAFQIIGFKPIVQSKVQ